MKMTRISLLCTALVVPTLIAAPASEKAPEKPTEEALAEGMAKHSNGSKKLANEQDDLSADVQDLIDEQTNPKVIDLLREVETIMADAIDQLELKDTGGATIATQTEVIEKIFEAAKKQQQQAGEGQGQPQSQGMMEMLQNMMEGGKDVGEGQQPGQGKKPGEGEGQGEGAGGGGKGSGGGGGKPGDPDNTAEGGERRVPKNSGNAGSSLPREFQKAMDAYNRGAAKKSTQR
ncbi:hypothetical protein JO972_02185 [Verrucomicrobiaceae bacterium 5K15]|uniref:Uncharacterized protein n=1 Tax=Oceaniferula flava TaxID=2800421 RepID=A0AAE2VCV7_9BACT|nr:hypothetical protein [Oceaniferula flavus]MBK1853754.1 hypothetical protein [Oceaniferula flavus]MBM1135061.1 hypothetical protein [Oceaniferula flavus]